MRLPGNLQTAIEQIVSTQPLSELTRAATELSDNYRTRAQTHERFLTSEAHRLAYLIVRLPATFAAVRAVLTEARERMPQLRVSSLLDLGAGSGAVMWAATETFSELQTITLLERDREMIRLGQSLAQHSDHAVIRNAQWQAADFRTTNSFPPHDVVICSYALNEVDDEAARKVLNAAWQATTKLLVIVEPGTMNGFNLIRGFREDLIQKGGHLLAPCPHKNACPLTGEDWCHFAQRFERSSLHRRLKQAELGYEDEKFSYLVFSKEPVIPAAARILRHPKQHAGYIQLQLCMPEGVQPLTVTKKHKDAWKRARKAGWGEAWENQHD